MKRKSIVFVLIFIEFISIFLMYKSSHNKQTVLDSVHLKEIVDGEKFAIKYETSMGEYTDYEDASSFPDATHYSLNLQESKCIDNSGEKLEGVLEKGDNNAVTVSGDKSSYCYLVFDRIKTGHGNINTTCDLGTSITVAVDTTASKYYYQLTDKTNGDTIVSAYKGGNQKHVFTDLTKGHHYTVSVYTIDPQGNWSEEFTKDITTGSGQNASAIKNSRPNNLNDSQAGMSRYQGSHTDVNNNYVIFGLDTCEEDMSSETLLDKYGFRIIGITDDGKMQLIKKTALGDNGVQWHSVARTTWNTSTESKDKTQDADVKWSQSDLYKKLNGNASNGSNIFVNSDTYAYMKKDSKWYSKIADTEWISGQLYWSNTYFDLSKIYNIESGKEDAPHYEEANPYYYNGGTDTKREDDIYNTRRQQDSVTCTRYDNTSINKVTCYKTITNQKFDDKVTAKIGLMHVYDYDYAVQKGGLNCFYDNVYDRKDTGDTPKQELTTCKNSWIHMSHNDTTVKGNGVHDWTLSRYGFSPGDDDFNAWYVYSPGYVSSYWVGNSLSARPVFYLESSNTFIGSGTLSSPYVVQG